MRLIDLKCPKCERIQLDHLERDVETPRPVCCDQPMERVFLPTNRGQVIGDECDVWIKNGKGMINDDGSPKHYTSKTRLKEAAEKAGWTNYVVHRGTKGGDKSKFTDRWT